jgi:hypothetical protein
MLGRPGNRPFDEDTPSNPCSRKGEIRARAAERLFEAHRRGDVLATAGRAVELLPESQNAFDGPQCIAALAQIYAWTGESDEAFRLLDHLLGIPNRLSIPLLKLDPVWDPLRGDPRFQALIDKYASGH